MAWAWGASGLRARLMGMLSDRVVKVNPAGPVGARGVDQEGRKWLLYKGQGWGHNGTGITGGGDGEHRWAN